MEDRMHFVADQRLRIDKFLSDVLADVSRARIQRLIEVGAVTVDDAPVKANYQLRPGQDIVVTVPEAKPLDVCAENLPLDIVYEDAHLLVVNKPQGMVVHPAAGNDAGTLVNALLFHCGASLSSINGVIRPGIVHRIDKDTSGLLLVAKDDETHLGLSRQIQAHTLTRAYIALAHGNFRQDFGTVDAPIGRHPTDRKRMCITERGRSAVTHYTVLERFGPYTFVECRLETGRTHQIRVHLASIGHPILGDPVYGVKKEKYHLNGQLLHARLVGFEHPISGKYMEFQTEVPERFLRFLHKRA